MTARTRVEAADAVVSVQAEGVDQATKKIKEVDKALGTLPAAAKSADAAAADSAKRWQELAGKVGAAVGAFASVQAMDLSTSSGLMGLAGVAATATAALGPLGLAVTAAAAGVNLLAKAWSDAEPSAEEMKAKLEAQKKAANEAKAAYQGLSAATGGFISTLDPAKQREFLTNQTRLTELDKEATDAAEDLNKALVARANNYARIFGAENAKRPEQFAFLETERVARQKAIDEQRREIQLRQEGLAQLAKGAGERQGLIDGIDNETKAVQAAAFSWSQLIEKVEQARAAELALFNDLETSRKAKQDADKAEFDQAVELMLWAEQTRADEALDAKKAIADEKRGLRELQGALADFYQWKAEERQRDLDTAMAVNAAALNATVAVAGAFGASEATLNKIKGVSAAADGILYGAKAYAAAGSLNPWSAVQYGLASVASFAASAAYFQAAGGGGGGTASAPSVPSGGSPASVSAPPENRGSEGGGSTTINVSFDRAQRPLTRGDERAIHAGVVRALSGPGGARGLGSRRVAS